MKKTFITILVFAVAMLFSSAAYCLHENKPVAHNIQKSSISGKVADKQTGESLAGVLVSIKDSGLNVYTDFDGNFSFDNIEPGTYIIEVKYISYSVDEIPKVTCKAGQETRINIGIKTN
ncbi:MAG TPA: carboxypeptidase-like regulatory domain-containing protein [Bacteroidales bacterium]|nr:carboxypeptidase-like regulatory domain-containing protein [Bacteroidales bacterium]